MPPDPTRRSNACTPGGLAAAWIQALRALMPTIARSAGGPSAPMAGLLYGWVR